MSSNSGDEMVDVKEVGNDVDETLKINLKDETAEGEAKGAPLSQETEESIENGEVKTVEIDSAADDMVDKAVVEEERVSDENVVGIPDVKSAETSSDDDDDASKKAEVDANGIHDEYFNVKLKSEEIVNGGANEDVVNAGANEDIADMDTKENEESHANVSNEKSEPEKYEDIVNSGANEDITDMDTKGNEDNQANVSNENSSPEKYEDIVNDDANEDIGDMNIKENEESQANVSNGKSLPEEFEEDDKVEDDKSGEALEDMRNADVAPQTHIKEESPSTPKFDEEHGTIMNTSNKSFLPELSSVDGYESGTEEEQAEFADEVKTFYRENNFEYKAPKFYKEDLNLLKLWRAVIKLGGYEQVTSCKLWRQVGESFRPPKTCTTVSWTFRIFYEKALLEYEKHKMRNGELPFSDGSLVEPVRVENQVPGSQALGSGRARRDAAARAMQGWHSQRLLGNGEDKNSNSGLKADKQLKTNGLLKRKKPSSGDRGANVIPLKSMRMDSTVIDIGPPADWVKVNVQRTSDCFEIYALVPGLLREEVHVQSDPAGRLIISGEPEHPDNPWGVTSFKKVVSLPSRIDPHQTSAVVTLHGQLFVRVPFEQLDV